jgi:phosphinothricin acetyltransferase
MPQGALAIRRATPGDLPEIMRIYNEALVERIATADMQERTLEERTEWFRQFDDRYPIWVGTSPEQGQRVLAYGVLYKYSPREGYRFAAENGVYISRDARGKGYGRAMLEHVISEAKRIGFKYILAKIFAHNEASIRLHAALGFKELGLQKQIVEMDGRWYDVLLMDLRL